MPRLRLPWRLLRFALLSLLLVAAGFTFYHE
jgi:hypothetical protein